MKKLSHLPCPSPFSSGFWVQRAGDTVLAPCRKVLEPEKLKGRKEGRPWKRVQLHTVAHTVRKGRGSDRPGRDVRQELPNDEH